MTTEQKEIMRAYISKMSFFNAAEGAQWSNERSKRADLKVSASIDILKWLKDGLDLDTLKEFHSENKQLTSFSDFISNNMINAVINNSLGVEI